MAQKIIPACLSNRDSNNIPVAIKTASPHTNKYTKNELFLTIKNVRKPNINTIMPITPVEAAELKY